MGCDSQLIPKVSRISLFSPCPPLTVSDIKRMLKHPRQLQTDTQMAEDILSSSVPVLLSYQAADPFFFFIPRTPPK